MIDIVAECISCYARFIVQLEERPAWLLPGKTYPQECDDCAKVLEPEDLWPEEEEEYEND